MPTIILIAACFPTSAKLREILRKYTDSAAQLEILQPAENWALVCWPGQWN